MNKKTGGMIGLVLLLAGVIVTIVVAVHSAKEDVAAYQEMEQTATETSEEMQQETQEIMNGFTETNSQAYEGLDGATE